MCALGFDHRTRVQAAPFYAGAVAEAQAKEWRDKVRIKSFAPPPTRIYLVCGQVTELSNLLTERADTVIAVVGDTVGSRSCSVSSHS